MNHIKVQIVEDMIYNVVRPLVDFPDKVKVISSVHSGQNTVVFGLEVDKTDLGKVIGKQGRNANALRVLMNAVATKNQIRALLDIGNHGRDNSLPL